MDYAHLRDVALEAARDAGAAARAHFRTPGLAVERKADDSPVTIADREAEAAARAVIRAACPDDGWLGEETGGAAGTSCRTWIVDPIDGTRNFVHGIPLWASLVACEEEAADGARRVVAAAVTLPGLGEVYEAYAGGGARCNGERIAVSSCPEVAAALWCFETPGWFRSVGLGPLFDHLDAHTRLQRGLGDAYGHMLVASGRADLVVEPALKVWDVAATSLVVREAGGGFTDITGRDDLRAGNALVTNGLLHPEALKLIAAHRV